VIRGFGLWSAVSAFVTLAAALTVVPTLLALGRSARPRPGRGSATSEPPFLDRVFARLARFDVRHRRAILVAGALLFVAALGAASRIQVNLAVIENFRPDSPVRQGYEAINRLFGGANQFYVMLEADRRGAFEEPEVLRAVDSLQAWLESQPEVGRTTSVVQYLEVIDAAMTGKRSIPDSQALAAQLLLFGANEELDQLIDPAHRVATILVRSSATETHQFDDLATRIDRRLEELPAGIRGEATGDAILLTRSAHRISRGQVLSLAAACGMIGLLLVGYFRSLRVGLYALVPNVLPVAIYFGILGLTGITLNNATALMGSIVLGVAVDDTLHLLVGYRRAQAHATSGEEAVSRALVEVGRPITGTTLAVALGLLVVGASALQNQAQFGLLGATTLVIAWAIDLTFTPALCAILDLRGPE
jgi:predicted RND superfamily exporter protein